MTSITRAFVWLIAHAAADVATPVRAVSAPRDAAVAAAKACEAACAVAATHHALARARWMGALVALDSVARRVRIVWTVAAGIEIYLGLGSAHGAEGQREGDE